MSRFYTDLATLEVNGTEEQDYEIRGRVDLEMLGSGQRAFLDGSPEVKVRGKWTDIDDLEITSDYRERIFDTLSECAFEDDRDECVDEDDDAYEEAS